MLQEVLVAVPRRVTSVVADEGTFLCQKVAATGFSIGPEFLNKEGQKGGPQRFGCGSHALRLKPLIATGKT